MPNQGDWGVRGNQLTQPPFLGPSDPGVIIFADPIPAELVAFYALEGSTLVSVIIQQIDSTTYGYDGEITNPLFDGARVIGQVGATGPTVSEVFRIPFLDGSAEMVFGRRGSVLITVEGATSLLRFEVGSIQFADSVGGTNITAPKGYRGANFTTVGNAAASSGAEDAIDSASWDSEPTYEFKNGYLYKATFTGGVALDSAVDSISNIRVRKGAQSTSGTVLCLWQANTSTAAATAVATKTFVGYFKNSSGADVSTKLSVTLAKSVGANVRLYGDGNIPLSLAIELIGKYSEQPGINASLASV